MKKKEEDDERLSLVLKLESKRVIDPDTGCWLWLGATTTGGYGAVRIDNQFKYVHRLSAVLHFEFDESSGLFVLHSCDVRACFNPDHLFAGTHADNMRDAAIKGRMGRGKLDAEKVREIRNLLAAGWTHASVADRYGVSPALISQISRGKVWRYVDDTLEGRSTPV